ncbi:MAG: hypothetical protein ACI4DU_00790 [Lachnospiraceae bacterium]
MAVDPWRFMGRAIGWNYVGDCRALTRLGNIEPTEGNYMASISTGIGNNMVGGALFQECYIPEEAEKLSVDWNFLSAEFLEYISSRYDDPFYISLSVVDEGSENVIGRYSVNSLAEEYGADNTSAGKLICVSPEVKLNDYSDIWMTGWNSTEYDISEYAGQYVTLKFSVANAADTGWPTLVLLDNIHTDVQYSFSADNLPVNDSITADVVRAVTPNDHGRSYVIYTEELNKDGQADGVGDRIQYSLGYENENQIEKICVSTEQEFLDAWRCMEPGEGDMKIDEVYIIMHGTYYALIIDNGMDENNVIVREPQNLTVSPDGKVGSDTDSYILHDLGADEYCKPIRALFIYSCNTGLLDAINVDFVKEDDEYNTTFQIQGNVAQAFLNSQDVDVVYAWDGSVRPLANGNARLSYKQGTFYTYWSELNANRVVHPYRDNFSCTFPRTWHSGDKDDIDNDPLGCVIYTNTDNGQYALYHYREETFWRIRDKYAVIDLQNNTVTTIELGDVYNYIPLGD